MSKALVVLSGGQDSTTCLFQACEIFDEVHAITFDYNQRHVIEIAAATKVAELAHVTSHEIIEIGPVLKGTSPLTNLDETLEQYDDWASLPGGLEKTFVPVRNALFLTLAANRAYCLGITTIITGVCEEDFGGYPDCRNTFIVAMQAALVQALSLGDDEPMAGLKILTPLMYMTKAASVELALSIPGCYDALAWTHTSYDGQYPPTGNDHATLLRAKGFEEANVPDPLVVRAWREGLMDLPDTTNYYEDALDRSEV